MKFLKFRGIIFIDITFNRREIGYDLDCIHPKQKEFEDAFYLSIVTEQQTSFRFARRSAIFSRMTRAIIVGNFFDDGKVLRLKLCILQLFLLFKQK